MTRALDFLNLGGLDSYFFLIEHHDPKIQKMSFRAISDLLTYLPEKHYNLILGNTIYIEKLMQSSYFGETSVLDFDSGNLFIL